MEDIAMTRCETCGESFKSPRSDFAAVTGVTVYS